MFGKRKAKPGSKPSAEAEQNAEQASAAIGVMLRGAFDMGRATERAMNPKPVTFADCVKARCRVLRDLMHIEEETQSLGFDLEQVKHAALVKLNARDHDEAMANR